MVTRDENRAASTPVNRADISFEKKQASRTSLIDRQRDTARTCLHRTPLLRRNQTNLQRGTGMIRAC